MKINLKSQITNFKSSCGFTLVELLASIIVLIAVGSVTLGIITSSLRGTNKTATIEKIRQDGNYAISQISKTIQNAQTFEGFSDNNIDYTTNCPDSFAPTPTPVNYKYIKITPFNNNSLPITYNCESTVFDSIDENGSRISVIDTSSVALTDCSIVCSQFRATDIPIIGISFTLGPDSASILMENLTPPILFETSVTARNYKR